MAKKKEERPEIKRFQTPSDFGSHKSMIVKEKTLNPNFSRTTPINDEGGVLPINEVAILQDEEGFYVTALIKLDTGLADTNRYGNPSARIPNDALIDVETPSKETN